MVERDNWGDKFDAGGNALVPAMPSIQETHDAMVRGESPSPEVQRAFGVEPTPATPAPVPAKSKGFSGLPDWNEKPRNESGQFISKSEGQLRQQWGKEGGLAQVAQTVMRKEAAMLSAAPSLEAKIA